MTEPGSAPERTAGTLLGGQVRYGQFRTGYRTGIEPVLLAAAVPARPGQRVLEAGCGAGAGLLCLLWRVPGLMATAIELQPGLASLARDNLRSNGFTARVLCGDVTAIPLSGPVDHAFANPPWHDPAGTRPPDAGRAHATHGLPLAGWIDALSRIATETLTLVLPASDTGRAASLLRDSGMGGIAVLELTAKAGRPTRIALIQATRAESRPVCRTKLALHREDGGYTDEADAVLRHGVSLTVAGSSAC